jgi:hypothetical protein
MHDRVVLSPSIPTEHLPLHHYEIYTVLLPTSAIQP